MSEAARGVDGGPLRVERDLDDLDDRVLERGVEEGDFISGSSTSISAGGAGGGRSGPSSPPTLGTPGLSLLIACTPSSSAMRNWTNVQSGQASLPKIEVSLRRSLCSG